MKSSLVWMPIALVVFLAFSGLGEQSAFGQTQTGDCSDDPPCKILAERAKQQSATGSLVEAFRLYELAYSVRADPTLLFNLARVLHRQGRTVDAVPYYKEYLESPVADEGQKAKARAYLQQAQLTPQEVSSMLTEDPALPNKARPRHTCARGILKATSTIGRDQGVQFQTLKSLVKEKWFWLVLGGSVLAASAITVGVTVGVNSDQSSAPRQPPTNTAPFMF